ncbi:PAS domain S-box protein [Peredibacter starrii]|uniref:histidine kinase n=1 Tax=Peredibacter starrii TaxID=28202 RepID=A0AAX4HQ73_9BACT|nr:PAS domain S-box protein [Peredibacter starrii]WPU65459.1 PAS domain S-box protein [Peredibacter starrii]
MEYRGTKTYLETLFQHAPAAMAVLNTEMRYIEVNELWFKTFNLNETIIGKSHYEIFPSIPEAWKEYHKRGMAGEVLRQQEDFHMLVNGEKVWINWEVRPWYADEHKIGGIAILIKDVTEKKLIEDARQEGERKFKAIFDQVGIGIIQTTPIGDFITVNEQFARMIGYSIEELKRMNFADITYPEDINKSLNERDKMLNQKTNQSEIEKRYVKKDGSIFWARLTVSLLSDDQGNPNYFISTIQDITSRKEAEEALIENEQKFRAIFDQTAMGMAQVSLDGTIITANEKCCHVLGYSLDELQKMNFTQFTHPEDVEKDMTLLEELIAGNIPTYNIEKRYIKKDGSVAWAFLTVSLVRGTDLAPKYLIAAIHDISARKANEEELRRSRRDLKKRVEERTAYLSLLQTISSEANKSDNVFEALKISLFEICKLTKWQIGHFYMVDRGHKDKVPRSDLWCLEDETFYKPFVDKTDQIKAHDVSIISRVVSSGRPFWSNDIFHDKRLVKSEVGLLVGIKSGMAFPVLVKDEVAGVLEFFSDINIHPSPALMELMSQIGIQLGRLLERQRAKEEAEQSQYRLQAILDNLPARVYLKDLNKKYLLVNKVFKAFFNMENEDLRGKTSLDYFSPEAVEPWIQGDDDVIKKGKVVSYEVTYGKNGQGRARTFQLTKFPVIDSDGEIYAYGGISIEITDIKETEDRIRALLNSEHKARTDAEKAILARDEFISIASHELKSPITALKMKVQLMLRQLNRDANPALDKFRGSMCKLEHDADRLVTLINRLLDITRIQTGHFELNREDIVVNDLITNLVENLTLQLETTDSKLEVDMRDTIHAHWDKSRIEQVITNLITNAIKFGEKKPIKLILESTDHRARIIVIDHGRGIPPEFKSKIFDRYERANVGEGIQGLGLGLYIVKQILESHGGIITVESELGKGSTFIVELPLSEKYHIHKKRPDQRPGLGAH